MTPVGGVKIRSTIMSTFVKDESGATAVEYGIFTSFAFGLMVVVYGPIAYKISSAMQNLIAALA